MPVLTTSILRKQLASGDTGPLYMLVGADELEKSAVATEFADMVEEGLRPFNVERWWGGDMKVEDLVSSASTFPMMASRRIVIILEAEKLLAPKRESKAADAEQEKLEQFIEHPPSHATVVFVCGSLDMRRRAVKLLAREAQVVDCGTIEDQGAAERWVRSRAAREGVTLDPPAVRALVERAGLDLVRLRAAFDRLLLYAMGQPTITADDVRQVVVASPEAQADFGIAKAIWRNDTREALKELGLVLEGGGIPVMVVGQLRAAAEKLPVPRLKSAIDAVFRTDLAIKSSGGDARVLLERLVVELCARR